MLGDVGRREVQFAYRYGAHEDSGGIRTITVDMCKKQAPGMPSPHIY